MIYLLILMTLALSAVAAALTIKSYLKLQRHLNELSAENKTILSMLKTSDQIASLEQYNRFTIARHYKIDRRKCLDLINNDKTLCIIGRGHSGTRAIAESLIQSGVYLGEPLNDSRDLIPPDLMYEACRVMSQKVVHRGDVEWDFSRLHSEEIDPVFVDLLYAYLASVLSDTSLNHYSYRGWKLPETTLVYPWIVRLFPDIKYIHWIRDPRDVIAGPHITDNLSYFNIPHGPSEDTVMKRTVSLKYHHDIVNTTPPPKHVITLRLEEFALAGQNLDRLSDFLGFEIRGLDIREDRVQAWRKRAEETAEHKLLAPYIHQFGY